MQTKEQKIEKLTKLVNKFSKYIDEYKNPAYNESDLRLEFLNPFFELLDWDVRNEENNHINYKDVVVEERINVYGSDNKKAPDYTFRIGGTKKFFVEAKKPSVDIKDAFEPAFQLKRYGHSAGLCLSILTDFEELSVYDTRKKPNKNDKPTKDRILYYKYTDYIEKFDEIYNLFSKTAIKQGSFEKFEKDDKHRKGSESIDEGILDLVDAFREILAKNIVKNNEDIDIPTLNKAVIKIIDRLFFLRIAEDKEVEPYKTLFNITSHSNIYENLKKIFKEADRRYNSELFKYFKDIDGLVIDDRILKEIIINLYTPECVYEFSQIPVSILGSMYEQFLGKTIRITDGGHVKIEEKPEVKKAGGVYYTPEYIVNYIVKNTVGEKIKGLTPKEIEKIKILDPACGSGSFLIGAYQYLIDYYIDYYTHEKQIDKALKNKLIAKTKDGYILSIPEKQRILLNNIFGVDIDQQAVEVAKFSLLLKLMESEDKDTSQGELFKEGHVAIQMLPNLSNNIKCGNSLIGTDYYDSVNLELFEKDDYNKINAFDWDKEFSEIFKSGGFDCVIGNPPYGADLILQERTYLENKFKTGNTDTACLFLFLAKNLSKTKGYNGFIIPKTFTYASNWEKARNVLLDDISTIVDCSKVWKEVKLEMSIYISQKNLKTSFFNSAIRKNTQIINIANIKKTLCEQFGFILNGVLEEEIMIAMKIKKECEPMKNICYINRGQDIQEYLDAKFDIPVYRCKSIQRYYLDKPKEGISKANYLKLQNDLLYMQTNKIIIQNIIAHIQNPIPHILIMATVDNDDIISLGSVGNIFINNQKYDKKFIVGILNSKLTSWYAYKFIYANAVRTMRFDNVHLEKLQIPKDINKKQHDKIIELVEQMLEIQKQLHSAKTESDKQFYQKKANIIDKQIDTLVYELYGLTAEEIKIIEGE